MVVKDQREQKILGCKALAGVFASLLCSQTAEIGSKLKYSFQLWKCHNTTHLLRLERRHSILMSSRRNSASGLGSTYIKANHGSMVKMGGEGTSRSVLKYSPYKGREEPEGDWFTVFWEQKRSTIGLLQESDEVHLTQDQLRDEAVALHTDVKAFWKFRCSNILKLMNLHLKRRARLLLAFSFQKYKNNIYRLKISWLLRIKEPEVAYDGSKRGAKAAIYVQRDDHPDIDESEEGDRSFVEVST
jgi:hypothetical protein